MVFVYFFLLWSILLPVAVVFSLVGMNAPMSMYGLDSSSAFTDAGPVLLGIFLLKFMVAWKVFTNHRFALRWAIVDAIIGIIICSWMLIRDFVIGADHVDIQVRFELIPLVLYLLFAMRNRKKWEASEIQKQSASSSGVVDLEP